MRDSRYAVEALAVREIAPLPELIPLEESPAYIVGVFSLRGQIVPVIDLNLRFGHPQQRPRLEDCVVILEQAGGAVGLLVNEALNARDIAPDEIAPLPSYGAEAQPESRFLTGLVKSGEQIVMLLHVENLLRLAPNPQGVDGAAETRLPAIQDAFGLEITPQESEIFRERARDLAQSPDSREQAGLLSLAVARIGGEFFGIALQEIWEFAEARNITPVPCCPEHIVGQMNLRGDLITLLDIAGALGLPTTREQSTRKVVVANNAELGAGVLVDEVMDALSVRDTDIIPAIAAPHTPGREYLRGATPYGSRMLTLLDLPALLRQESFIVNERP